MGCENVRQAGRLFPWRFESWHFSLVHYTELYSCFLSSLSLSFFYLSLTLLCSPYIYPSLRHFHPHTPSLWSPLLCAHPLRLTHSLFFPTFHLPFLSLALCIFQSNNPTLPVLSWQALSSLCLSTGGWVSQAVYYCSWLYPCGKKHLDEATLTFYITPLDPTEPR